MGHEARSAELAIYHLMSNKRKWSNCFIKNSHKISIKFKVLTLFCKKKKQQNEDVQVTSGLAMV